VGTKTIFDMGKNLRVTPERLQLFERIIAEPFNPKLLHSSLHQAKRHEEALKHQMEEAALIGLEVPGHAIDALKYLQEIIFRAVALAPKDLHGTPPDHPNCRCQTTFQEEMQVDYAVQEKLGGVSLSTSTSKQEAELQETSFIELMKKLGREQRQGGWWSNPAPASLPVQGLVGRDLGRVFRPTRTEHPPIRFIKAVLKEAIKFIREHQGKPLDDETTKRVIEALQLQKDIRELYPDLYEEVNKELDAEVEADKKELKENEEAAIESANKAESELTKRIREQREVKERLKALGKKIRGRSNGRKEVPEV